MPGKKGDGDGGARGNNMGGAGGAEQLSAQAMETYQAGDYDGACTLYSAALDNDKVPSSRRVTAAELPRIVNDFFILPALCRRA